MGVFSCFRGVCGPQPLVPEDHCELTREELKRLYEQSLKLNGGRLIVHGIFARANTKNNNKRVYPKYILKREVTIFDKDHVQKGTALGELDHPNYSSRYFKCLNLPNISHQVLEVHWRGDLLWGSIEVLPTPSGLLLRELYAQGIKLGVSSRGWASLRADSSGKCIYVEDDFELITFDFVTEPSTRGAFLVPVMCTYPHRVPDQRHATQLAHLGVGVVSMRNITYIPPIKTLVERINQLQVLHRQGQLAQPPPAGGQPLTQLRHNLDQLLLFSHYIVFAQLPYLDREEHARDFQSHLAMFATRAHLADQMHIVSRSELNAIILKEIAKEQQEEGLETGVVTDKVTAVSGVGGVVAAVVPHTAVKTSAGMALRPADTRGQYTGVGVGQAVVAGELHEGPQVALTIPTVISQPTTTTTSCSTTTHAAGTHTPCGTTATEPTDRPSRSSRRARAHQLHSGMGVGMGHMGSGSAGSHPMQPADTALRIPTQSGSTDTQVHMCGQGGSDLDQWHMNPGAIELTPPPPHNDNNCMEVPHGVVGAHEGNASSLAAAPPLQPRHSQRHAHADSHEGVRVGTGVGVGPRQDPQAAVDSGVSSVQGSHTAAVPTHTEGVSGVGGVRSVSGHMSLAQRLSGVHQSASTDSLQHPPVQEPRVQGTGSAHMTQQEQHIVQQQANSPTRAVQSTPTTVPNGTRDPIREVQIAVEFQHIKATLSSFGGRLWAARDLYLADTDVRLPFDTVAEAPALCPLQPKGTHRPPPRQG